MSRERSKSSSRAFQRYLARPAAPIWSTSAAPRRQQHPPAARAKLIQNSSRCASASPAPPASCPCPPHQRSAPLCAQEECGPTSRWSKERFQVRCCYEADVQYAAAGEPVHPTHAPDAWPASPMGIAALSCVKRASVDGAGPRTASPPRSTAGGASTGRGGSGRAGRSRGWRPPRCVCWPQSSARRDNPISGFSSVLGGRHERLDHSLD